MLLYRYKLPPQGQILTIGFFLTAAVLISLSLASLALALWLMFLFVSVAYCAVQCSKRFSGVTKGNKILLSLVVLALVWKIVHLQAAIPASSGGNVWTSAVHADVYLVWTYLSPIFSALLLMVIILSPESQLTALQIRDRRTLNKLCWQQSVSSTSKVLFYTTLLVLVLLAVSAVIAQLSDNAWSGYLDADVWLFLPEMLLHLLGLMFYAELLTGKSAALQAAAGSAQRQS